MDVGEGKSIQILIHFTDISSAGKIERIKYLVLGRFSEISVFCHEIDVISSCDTCFITRQ